MTEFNYKETNNQSVFDLFNWNPHYLGCYNILLDININL